MLDDLLGTKRITQAEYDLYVLFQSNELGRKCLNRMIDEAFMDEPKEKEFSGEGFAFYDGRRSVLRDIRRAIDHVNYVISESEKGISYDR